MKKAKRAICLYKCANDGSPVIMSYAIIENKGNRIDLISYEVKPEPYHYENFYALYVACIRLAITNDYSIPYYEAFGGLVYQIDFISLDTYSYHYGSICNYAISMRDLQHYMLQYE